MENKSKNSLNHQQKTTNLWQEILREAMPKTETDNTNLYVFGDSMTGKRLLFKGMNRAIFENSQDSDDKKRENQRIEEIAKFSLVDYTFLNIQEFPHDKDAEIIGKLNVWIMNFFIDKEKIMEIIKPNDLLNSICLIVTDLSRPWMVKESLIKWTNLIQETFDELIKKLPENLQNKIKDNVIRKIKLYQDPELDAEGRPIMKQLTPEEEKIKLKTPLKEGVLKINCGVPLVFVINKSDVVVESQNKRKIEEDSEFILSHIRLLALKYGATIIYTSGKTNINLTVLYDYICHVLFNFELVHKPNFIEKEAYFIPAGYDDLTLLKSNEEIKKYLEESYEDRIKKENNEKQIIEEDIQCEDTNTFFESLKKKGVKGKDNKMKSKDILNIEQKKSEIINEIKKEENLKPQISKSEKDKKYEDKKKDIQEREQEKLKIKNSLSHNLEDKKENKIINKDAEKKNKTRENMIAKLKNMKKKEAVKKK